MHCTGIDAGRMGKFGWPVEKRLVSEHDMPEAAVVNVRPERIARLLLTQTDEATGRCIDEPRAENLAEPVALAPGKLFGLPDAGWKAAHVARNPAVHDQHVMGAQAVERHSHIQEGPPRFGQLRCQRRQLWRLGSLLGGDDGPLYKVSLVAPVAVLMVSVHQHDVV